MHGLGHHRRREGGHPGPATAQQSGDPSGPHPRLGWTVPVAPQHRHTLPFDRAVLRFAGYPREVFPEGQKPGHYDYQDRIPDMGWKTMAGRLTAHGPVDSLLSHEDGKLAVMNHGDEIALGVRADRLPPLPEGWKRTFFLLAVGWCKDMDPYTAFPDTIGPMPRPGKGYPERFRGSQVFIGRERLLRGTFR